MITPEYCQAMARYNAWQNRQLIHSLETVSNDTLRENHGAFFESILGTLNHILWGDRMWMSRFDPSVEKPAGGIAGSTEICPTIAVWGSERFHLDGEIIQWAKTLKSVGLTGNLEWYSAAAKATVVKPVALCIVHMFNHQTHHRGQVHAMMTRAGLDAPVSDLFLMPETA